MVKATIKANEQFNSTEIFFDQKPEREIIEALKALKFRWNPKKACWYGFAKIESLDDLTNGSVKPEKIERPKKEKANKYGVKVGDFFMATWGYDQTNNDFFQVIELVGESSVRVREVNPPIISTDPICGMSEDRTVKLDRSEILPPSPYSVFIDDQEKGDLKRIRNWSYNGSDNLSINVGHQTASYVKADTLKVYESWYH